MGMKKIQSRLQHYEKITSGQTQQKTPFDSISVVVRIAVEVQVTSRPTASQSAYLGIGHPFGAHDQISLFAVFCWKIALLFILGRPL
jgi:hypothetical protein